MDKAREKHLEEMFRLEKAIRKTNSEYLKRDYGKKLKQMQKELDDYDSFRRRANG